MAQGLRSPQAVVQAAVVTGLDSQQELVAAVVAPVVTPVVTAVAGTSMARAEARSPGPK